MKSLLTLIICCISILSNAQGVPFSNDELELGRFEYSLLPSIGSTRLEKTSITFNMPKKLKKSTVSFGLNYTKYNISFSDIELGSRLTDFENIHAISFNLIYRRSLKNNWSLNALISPMLSSTLTGEISGHDFVFNTMLSASKIWFKDNLRSNLTLGLGYGTLFGRPRLFPMVSYSKQISEKSRYIIGLPVTGFFYDFNERNGINLTASPEGLFANNTVSFVNQQNVAVVNSKFEFNGLKLALGYKLKFGENWVTRLNLGYIPVSTMQVLDSNNETLYDINTSESIFLNIAVSFN